MTGVTVEDQGKECRCGHLRGTHRLDGLGCWARRCRCKEFTTRD